MYLAGNINTREAVARMLQGMPMVMLNGIRRENDRSTHPIQKDVESALKMVLSDDKARNAKAVELYRAALEGGKDSAAHRQLCGLRTRQVLNYIYASINIAKMFFNVEELAIDERPHIYETMVQEIAFGYIAEDGSPGRMKVDNDVNSIMIPLKYLKSEFYRYQLEDIYQGDISKATVKTLQIAYDLKNQIDALAKALLYADLSDGGVFGDFTLTGNKLSRVYVANSRINTANLPDTNDIELAGNSGSTKFRLLVCREIRGYCDKWADAFVDGMLNPTGEILIPSSDTMGIADELVPTSSDLPVTNLVQDTLNNYTSFRYLGVNWKLIPDNTLEPGVCLARLNKEVGTMYTKPKLNKEIVRTFEEDNYEERMQRQPIGFYAPVSKRVNILRLRYRDEAEE